MWIGFNCFFTKVWIYIKKTNIHISRQSLRYALIEQLGGSDIIKWGHQLIHFKESDNKGVNLSFNVNGKIKEEKAEEKDKNRYTKNRQSQ